MDYYKEKENLELAIIEFENKDKAVFGNKPISAPFIMTKLDDFMFIQQMLYEEALELMPRADRLLDYAERLLKDKKLEIYNQIIEDQSINKSNRLTILELKSKDYEYVVNDSKLLKNKIQTIIEKEKERLWTIRAMKKSFM